MDDADGPTLDQIVQAFVLDAPSRGSSRVRIVVQGDELQACFFNGADFQVGVVVPANWIDRVERRLKLMANIILTDPRVPQRGRFRRAATVGGRFCELDVEVSTNPDPATRSIELTIKDVRWGAATTSPSPRLLGEDVVLFRQGPRGRPTRG
jgi:type II secretory ATPase GspE/PulE/Tfp pilus assembly ATPase PilB-like protein